MPGFIFKFCLLPLFSYLPLLSIHLSIFLRRNSASNFPYFHSLSLIFPTPFLFFWSLKCEYSCRTFHSLSLSASRTVCSHTLTSTTRTALFCQIYTCPWSLAGWKIIKQVHCVVSIPLNQWEQYPALTYNLYLTLVFYIWKNLSMLLSW